MEGATPERLRVFLDGWQGPLGGPAGQVVVELALCFTVGGGRPDPKPFALVAALAQELGTASPQPQQATTDFATAELYARYRALGLSGDAARAVLSCLFLVGVCRGALSEGQRQVAATVAQLSGIALTELNELARRVLAEAGRSSDEARALPTGDYAIISDIHANVAALEAVFRDIDAQGIRRVGCLGDVVGYGPDPIECTDLIRTRCAFTLMGNHDVALFEGAKGFNPAAKRAVKWTRDQLRAATDPAAAERVQFLQQLPLERREGTTLFVHGSPRDPWREYIFPDEVKVAKSRTRKKFREIFAAFEAFLFVGHTHLPCVITDQGFVKSAKKLEWTWTRPEGVKAIVNVGSVGQPRDRDPRPCYCVVSGDTIHWRRVEYPAERTVQRIEQNAELDAILGKRLLKGV